ncbi:hypothetical protein H1Z61_06865 [Bacillus aquiflavi]|uniref:Uncharacterized protein n=1 Tax=Bacillus aquiflavi TaxID=2672567 RepID=A0A6B3VY88_9BACI|nr:hypothetical protein [Bacillus aquiflavi]MBA4536868.1 hypothetical protein [Bacillus aquiflavi]NEY81235.1 hypothetical protein [Bacillus aquiflavi]
MSKDINKKRNKKEEGKKGADDSWASGCLDVFILPIQIFIAGYSLFNIV